MTVVNDKAVSLIKDAANYGAVKDSSQQNGEDGETFVVYTRRWWIVGGASAFVTLICVLCTLRTQISRSPTLHT
jgi:uncharacterized membrane protein YdfJ with MMPL/SSD domain